MTINGIELNFKPTNVAVAERYETALKTLQKKGEELEKKPLDGLAANIRAQIDMVHEFMDLVFGEGTYGGLGVDPDDLEENLDLVAQVNADAARQSAEMKRKIGKYTPNRSKRYA